VFKRDGVYENSIRLAAFLARKYLEAGIPVSFITNGRDCVSNRPGYAAKGQTLRHLREIYEILARIDLNNIALIDPIIDYLPGQAGLASEGTVVALISSYADEAVYEWYGGVREAGTDILWVAPRCENDNTAYRGGVVVWMVENE
jgi:hypothetical protein